MSESSYQRNVAIGVTGQKTHTCWPAALEQVSPQHEYVPFDYRTYTKLMNHFELLDAHGGQGLREIYPTMWWYHKHLFEEVGCDIEDVVFRRATNAYNLGRTLRKCMNDGNRVVLDLDLGMDNSLHAVGILAHARDTYRLVSTYVPRGIKIASADDLFSRLAMPNEGPSKLYPFKNTNITILPAE